MANGKKLAPLNGGAKHAQLSEKVAMRVREAIMVGDYRSPDYIRTEQLAADLGVSPTPVREALMVLASEGSVKWEPRRGFRVVHLSARDIRDLFLVQAFAAGELAARATTLLTDDDLDRLDEIQAKLKAEHKKGRFAEVDRLNHEVHRMVNNAADSARLANLLRTTVQYVPLSSYGEITGWANASAHDHAAIFKAFRSRDADAAREAMSKHINHVGDLLVAHLKRHIGLD
ncbi:DNA-binding GntR family transcriptional regulator [Antricoccus suffuscus]|uniref:DNA-binding GntR family transcriptional regulator n=1 Tax=Antricoccus suffuscus TaxID=1629062 RepID=A0A2T0ZZF0_9ACTN|nr:GntR family transcriptional regulator [Antricoccus suffuscus]PRZ41736.1 DNA-binding GntR family transcriptional regulator [Antricoccus suffuscus]